MIVMPSTNSGNHKNHTRSASKKSTLSGLSCGFHPFTKKIKKPARFITLLFRKPYFCVKQNNLMKKLHLGSSLRAIIPLLINFAVLLSLNGQNLSFSTPPPPPPPGVDSAWTPTTKGDINYLLLIPFNDHGKWGWSDTLGNVVIQPKFKQAGFFETKIVNNNNCYEAKVKTERGSNIYIAGTGLMVPEAYEWHWYRDIHSTTGHCLAKNDKGKYGVYLTMDQKFSVPVSFDSVSIEALDEQIILLKNQSDKTYTMYLADKKRSIKTDITEVRSPYLDQEGQTHYITLAVHRNNKLSKISDGKLEPFNIDDKAMLSEEEEFMFLDESFDSPFDSPMEKMSFQKPQEPPIAYDFSNNPSAKQYGFQKLVLQKQDGKMGVVNEKGDIILPFIYDKIEFIEAYTQALLTKKGKVGRKLFFSSYPVIEPKYDFIERYHFFGINEHWQFEIFIVKIGNNEGYVGENGVEYFRFD